MPKKKRETKQNRTLRLPSVLLGTSRSGQARNSAKKSVIARPRPVRIATQSVAGGSGEAIPSNKIKPKARTKRHSGEQSDSRIRKKTDSGRARSSLARMTMRTKILFALGFLFVGISLFWHINQYIQLAYFTPKVVPVEKAHPIPTWISIPKVSVELPIEQETITRGVWGVSQKGASHLTISARPGEKGPIIMYSHNTNERFGPIRWLEKGDEIVLTTAESKTHKYKITQTMTVAPDKMEVLTQHKDETLILYTCDGFADLQRFVIIAIPSK